MYIVVYGSNQIVRQDNDLYVRKIILGSGQGKILFAPAINWFSLAQILCTPTVTKLFQPESLSLVLAFYTDHAHITHQENSLLLKLT